MSLSHGVFQKPLFFKLLYNVFTERGDTLESIAREFQKRKIELQCGCSDGTIPVAANYLLETIKKKDKPYGVNGFMPQNTAEQLPAGLSFDYTICNSVLRGFNFLI